MLAGAPLTALLEQARVGTPAYVYDLDGISDETGALEAAFGSARHLIAYAVKANSAGSVVRTIAAAGAGADIVSGAELELALGCGITPNRIVMSGVAKSNDEIDLAIVRGIAAIQAESVEEILRIARRAVALQTRARVSLRVNPGVQIDSHAHVATGHDEAKFGIAREDLGDALRRISEARESLELVGVSAHVGSMLSDVQKYLESAKVVCEVASMRLSSGDKLDFVDFGGGFAIDYGGTQAARPADFARGALELLREQGLSALRLVVEPGRALVGPYGVLLGRVIQGKLSGARRWAMIDAGMNDLLRPALYGARHRIEPVEREPGGASYRVVGPVCESADDFGEHALGEPIPELVVIRDAGAYGFTMASNYNGRALPAEVFAADGRVVGSSTGPGAETWVAARLGA